MKAIKLTAATSSSKTKYLLSVVVCGKQSDSTEESTSESSIGN